MPLLTPLCGTFHSRTWTCPGKQAVAKVAEVQSGRLILLTIPRHPILRNSAAVAKRRPPKERQAQFK
eukprot:409810-Alexandrium_andersonii.AAC.1